MPPKKYDVAVVGGGIIGLATGRALCLRFAPSLVVLEAEPRLASHQTGHNSGVIHSGLYYAPGSLKATTCAAGRDEMYRYCRERGLPHERCGKLVVAADASQVEALRELERRGRANGLAGLAWLGAAEVAGREPHVRGVAGLLVPQAGICDFRQVAAAMAGELRERGAEIVCSARVTRVERRPDGLVLGWAGGAVEARWLINCAGLQSDRVARLCGVRPGLRVVPFRGEYYQLVPERRHLVRHLVYPVPDARLPFLGVHLTRTVGGAVEAGPNAAPALKREGYGRFDFSLADAASTFGYRGFWRLARRHWRAGLAESRRSLSTAAFVRALQRLVPEIGRADVVRKGAGIRAQAVTPDGRLLDDFHVLAAPRMLHVLNAPSPAATASLAIGREIAERARVSFDGLDGGA